MAMLPPGKMEVNLTEQILDRKFTLLPKPRKNEAHGRDKKRKHQTGSI